jgi:hypothetical protein
MMRPTASSANKFHEKTDTKPVSKTTSASKAPRQSIGGRVPERAASQSKPKTTLRPQSEKSQAANKAPVRDHQPPQKKQESEKENIVEPTPTSPKEPVTVEKTYVAAVEQPQAVAKPAEEVSAPIQTGKLIEEATSTIEPLKKSAEVSESVIEAPLEPIKSEGKDETEAEVEVPVELQPVAEAEAAIQAEVEASAGTIEPIPETGEEEKSVETSATPGVADTTPAQADETVDEPKTSAPAEVEVAEQQNVASEPEFEAPSDSKVEVSEKDETIPAKDITIPETSAEPEEQVAEKTAEEKPTEVRPATEAESSNVALDITTLALN